MANTMKIAALFLASCFGISSCFTLDRCDGVPCVCFEDIDCFPNRAECNENRLSILPERPDKIGTQFYLFTSNNTEGTVLTFRSTKTEILEAEFDTSAETKIIIHGFSDSSEGTGVVQVKEAFQSKGTYNIIMVDWQNGAGLGVHDVVKFWTIYRQASQNIRIVAKQLAMLLEQLNQEVDLKYEDVHLIGHSLGAHAAALAAANMSGVGRITGCDPAKPNFEGKDPACRLDADDAKWVDVIHTDIEQFGTNEQSGDIDFWPNEGRSQPGCLLLGCSHGRSLDYFASTIRGNCTFSARPCKDGLAPPCKEGPMCTDCPQMGLTVYDDGHRGNFYVNTKSKDPYC